MLATAFALLCAVAGWHYMFFSSAAARLEGIEGVSANRRRILLRRICGGAMFLLGVCFFAGFHSFDTNRPGRAFFLVWMAVFLLLAVILVLGSLDVVMTLKLRRRRQEEKP